MMRNYLIAALRNLARNKLYAGVNIIGLAAGFAAAILIVLYVKQEFSYDRWIPGYERVFRVSEIYTFPGTAARPVELTLPGIAALMKVDFPSILAVARLHPQNLSIRHGDIEANESVAWVDGDFFTVMPMPVIAGDLTKALAQPDDIVLTRSIAYKYFGRDDVVGELLEIDRQHPMRVTAVLEDLPSSTHLAVEIIALGQAAFSRLATIDRSQASAGADNVYTYLRLRPGASPDELRRAMPDFVKRHMPALDGPRNAGGSPILELIVTPIADIHLHPAGLAAMKPAGDPATLYGLTIVALLIVLIAGLNFVNLMTARASQRAVEVGVRKTAGANRWDLIVQFVGEAVIYVCLAMLIAIAVVEMTLPPFNAFMNSEVSFDYWRDPRMGVTVLVLIGIVSLCAGLYPAFVLSNFRPTTILKKGLTGEMRPQLVRNGIVLLQFVILVVVLVATLTVYRQTEFALNEGLRVNKDQVLIINGGCNDAFRQEVSKLPGVIAAACASQEAMYQSFSDAPVRLADGREIGSSVRQSAIDFGFFELYGLKPLAGRFFSREFASDGVARGVKPVAFPSIVIDESAVRKFGFVSPANAIGQKLDWLRRTAIDQTVETHGATVIGVVPDFSFASVKVEIEAHLYYVDANALGTLNAKLDGRQVPETLAAIDQLWRRLGEARPITHYFLDDLTQKTYLDIRRQSIVFAAFSGLVLFIACIGLFGLAAFAAERRTKEIGIRKAMGAKTGDILRLLTWEFSKPVLWANVVAWPVAYFAMGRWLGGFAYHIDLALWMFLSAGALALAIALATVSAHSYFVARAKPVEALRYE